LRFTFLRRATPVAQERAPGWIARERVPLNSLAALNSSLLAPPARQRMRQFGQKEVGTRKTPFIEGTCATDYRLAQDSELKKQAIR
jgi:hypothetical protein